MTTNSDSSISTAATGLLDATLSSRDAQPDAPVKRSPRWLGDFLGLLVCCIVVLVAFSPVLFGGRTLSAAGKGAAGVDGIAPFPGQPAADYRADFRPDQGASTWQFEPWSRVNDRTYGEGELPFWNPYQGAGAPQAANMQSAPFDPLLLAVNLHPTQRVWDLSIIAAFVLGAAATFLFSRVLGLVVVSAITASVAYSLSGFFLLYSNNQFSRSYCYLPILVLFVEITLRTARMLPIFLLGLATAGTLLVGMPEASLFVVGASVAYAAARVFGERHTIDWRVASARVGGGFLLGTLITAPLLFSFEQYVALSHNTHKGSTAGNQSDSVWGLLNWIVPHFHGVKAPFNSPLVRDWSGAGVAALALVGLSGRHETRARHAPLFFVGASVLLLKIYDLRVLAWVGELPILRQATFPVFAPPVVMFCVAMLAGIGVQVAWRRDLVTRRFLLLCLAAVVALVLVALSDQAWDLITRPSRDETIHLWGTAAVSTGLVIGAVLFSRRSHPRVLAVFAAVIVIVELFSFVPFHIYARRSDPYAAPGWMTLVHDALRREPNGRVLGLDAKLFPDTASGLGLQDIRVVDALYVDRYWRYIRTFIQPTIVSRFNGGPFASEERSAPHYQSNPMFDLLAVRAFVTQQPLETTPTGDEPNAVALRLLGAVGDTMVYENVGAYPRAWVVHRVHRVADEDAAFGFLAARGHRERGRVAVDAFDPRREAVVESDRPVANGRCAGGVDRARITSYTSDSVDVRVRSECGGLLVLPDVYFPGWSAKVNGEATNVYATNGAFRSVSVPAGESTVEFRYEPSRWRFGLFVAGSALAAFCGIALLMALRRRGHSARGSSLR